MNAEALKAALRAEARAEGFDAFGVTKPQAIGDVGRHFEDWIAEGAHGDMDWLARTRERRADPNALWPQARSVIVLGLNYGPDEDPLELLAQRGCGAISVYARGDDYHELIKGKLKRIGQWLVREGGGEIKVFVDTAPVMEKPLAAAAGLGWQGKHTNLVSREFGSWLFLGAIFTTIELPSDEAESDHCGNCRACLDICPTAAFPAPYQLDARRCISYLTIELKGSIPLELRPLVGNRVFGCDDCQLVCPWNRYAQLTPEADFQVRNGLDSAELAGLFAWTEDEFRQRMSGSAIRRIGYERWLRNLAVGLGNAPGSESVLAALRSRAQHPSALVREHVAWALERHGAF